MRSSGFETVVSDNDILNIDLMRGFGIKSFFCDPARLVTLRAARLREAQLLVVTLNDVAACLKLVKLARQARPDLHIIARIYYRRAVKDLAQRWDLKVLLRANPPILQVHTPWKRNLKMR